MQQLVSEFQTTLDALDSVIASRLMQMALEAARQVIGQTPTVDNSALIKQIQQLLQQEPLFSGKPQLRVHPDDLQRVDDMLGATLSLHGWRLRGDPTLHPGGCKVSADEGDLDASVATAGKNSAVWQHRSGVMTTRLTRWLTTLDNFEAKMAQLPAVRRYGRLTRATGLVLEATGLQLPLGATCVIERQNGSETHEVESEVVGFNGQRLF